jgi:hypothetical protein
MDDVNDNTRIIYCDYTRTFSRTYTRTYTRTFSRGNTRTYTRGNTRIITHYYSLLLIITHYYSLLLGKHLHRDHLSDHGTQREARSPYIKQHAMLTVNDMHISTLTHAQHPQLTCICHGVTDIDNTDMTPDGA